MILLDTHILVWWATKHPKLSARARDIVENASVVYVSPISFFEISIKASKLNNDWTAQTAPDLFARLGEFGFEELPLRARDTFEAGTWPSSHHDPFDRLLYSQAVSNDLDLLTADGLIQWFGTTNWILV